MITKELLEEVRTITLANMVLVREQIAVLTENQKSWKLNESSWSINEVFAHLNEYAKYYHTSFITRIDKTRFRTPRINFISSPLGKSAWQSMKLGNAKNVKRKFKTLKAYNPIYDLTLLSGSEIAEFEKGQLELLDIIEKSREVSLRKVKIPISISTLIRFRLGDALLFVVYHNERHVQQALNVISNRNFPKN
jgi:hypothetical protein